MKIFRDVVLYLAIGGLWAGAAHNLRKERCNESLPDREFILIATLWPAGIAAALMIDGNEKMTCDKKEARHVAP